MSSSTTTASGSDNNQNYNHGNSVDDIGTERRSRSGSSGLLCPHCMRSCTSIQDLTAHASSCRRGGGSAETNSKRPSPMTGFICPVCTENLGSIEALNNHSRACTVSAASGPAATSGGIGDATTSCRRTGTVDCPSCQQNFSNAAALAAHFPGCAATTDYFNSTHSDAPRRMFSASSDASSDWVDVSSEALPTAIHEGMLAIRERVFVIQHWKVFWAVLHSRDISWYLDNQLRGKIDLDDVEFVEEVAAGSRLSPPYRSSLFAATAPSGPHTALRIVKRDFSAEILVAPNHAAQQEWLAAIGVAQAAKARKQAEKLLNELQDDLLRVRNPHGCENFERYLIALKSSGTDGDVNAAKKALIDIATYLRQYRKIVKSKSNSQLAAVAKLQDMRASESQGAGGGSVGPSSSSGIHEQARRWHVLVGGFKHSWPRPELRIKECTDAVHGKVSPNEWKAHLQPLFHDAMSLAKSLPDNGIAVRVNNDGTPATKMSDSMYHASMTTHGQLYQADGDGASAESTSSSRGSDSVGDTFEDHFVLLEEIGHGAFGVVRRCVDRATGISWAVKCISKEKLSRNENALDNLTREIAILKDLNHPAIVSFRGMWESSTTFYIVMELVIGEELFDRVVDRGFLQEAEARDLAKKLVDAIAYLHRRGIAHRDIKPENILLTYSSSKPAVLAKRGGGVSRASEAASTTAAGASRQRPSGGAVYSVKIVDFGFADTVSAGKGGLSSSFGSPWYVAPEILEHKIHGVAVDMWSFGVVLFVLLCGSPPFQHRHLRQLYDLIKRAEFSFRGARWGTVSPEAKDLICSCLVPDAAKRLTAEQCLSHPWLLGKTMPARTSGSFAGLPQTSMTAQTTTSVGGSSKLSGTAHRTLKQTSPELIKRNILKSGYLLVPPIANLPQRFAIGSKAIAQAVSSLHRRLGGTSALRRNSSPVNSKIPLTGSPARAPRISGTDGSELCTEQLLAQQFGAWWSPKVLHRCARVDVSLHSDHCALVLDNHNQRGPGRRNQKVVLHRHFHDMEAIESDTKLNAEHESPPRVGSSRAQRTPGWQTKPLRRGEALEIPMRSLVFVEVIAPPTLTAQTAAIQTRALGSKHHDSVPGGSSSNSNDVEDAEDDFGFEEVFFSEAAPSQRPQSANSKHLGAGAHKVGSPASAPSSPFSHASQEQPYALVLHCRGSAADNNSSASSSRPTFRAGSGNTGGLGEGSPYCVVFLAPTRTAAFNWQVELNRARQLHQSIEETRNQLNKLQAAHMRESARHERWIRTLQDDATQSTEQAMQAVAAHRRELCGHLHDMLSSLAQALREAYPPRAHTESLSAATTKAVHRLAKTTGSGKAATLKVEVIDEVNSVLDAPCIPLDFARVWVSVRDFFLRELPFTANAKPHLALQRTLPAFSAFQHVWRQNWLRPSAHSNTREGVSEATSRGASAGLTAIVPSLQTAHTGHVSCIACDPTEDSWLLSGSRSGELVLWDLDAARNGVSGEIAAIAAAKVPHAVLAAALAVDLCLAVGGTSGGSLIMWQLPDAGNLSRDRDRGSKMRVNDKDVLVIPNAHSNQVSQVQFLFPKEERRPIPIPKGSDGRDCAPYSPLSADADENPWSQVERDRRFSNDSVKPVFLATAGWDCTVVLWDAFRMHKLCVLYTEAAAVGSVITCIASSATERTGSRRSGNNRHGYVDFTFASGLQCGKTVIHTAEVQYKVRNAANSLTTMPVPLWGGKPSLSEANVASAPPSPRVASQLSADSARSVESPLPVEYETTVCSDDEGYDVGVACVVLPSFKEVLAKSLLERTANVASGSNSRAPGVSSTAFVSHSGQVWRISHAPSLSPGGEQQGATGAVRSATGISGMDDDRWCVWSLALGASRQSSSLAASVDSAFDAQGGGELIMLRQLQHNGPVRSLFVDPCLQLIISSSIDSLSIWFYDVCEQEAAQQESAQRQYGRDLDIQVARVARMPIPAGVNCATVMRQAPSRAGSGSRSLGTIQRVLIGVKTDVRQYMLNIAIPDPRSQ